MTALRTVRRQLTPLEPVIERLKSAEVLDAPARLIASAVRGALPPGSVKDAVSGTWLGHALHPLLTDLVIGSFVSASLLDLLGGDESGAARKRLIAVGIAAYGPTALTGASDWSDSESESSAVRRVGLVHAGSNLGALTLYAASLAARRRGAQGQGKLLGAAGATVLMAGGFLGGHLSYSEAVGPDRTAFDPGPADWAAAGPSSLLGERGFARVLVGETPVLFSRDGDVLSAIHDRCSHRGCSLSEGQIDGARVTCRCHGSRFDLRSGALERGPATAPQPAFEVRERGGVLEIRRLVAHTVLGD